MGEILSGNIVENFVSRAYLCGSPGIIDACVKLPAGSGVPEKLIYYNKFG